MDGLLDLHPFPCRIDHRVGCGNDVVGRTVVVSEVDGPGTVVLLEPADEFHGGAIERVDVLIVVPYREERELACIVIASASRKGGNQFVLVCAYVLVLVHQNPAKTR